MRGCQVVFIIIGAPIVALALLILYAKIMITTGNTSMQAQHAATGPIVIGCVIVIGILFLSLLSGRGNNTNGKQ